MPKTSAKIDSYLSQEYIDLGIEARWLQPDKALNAYSFAMPFCRSDYYALDPNKVESFSEHKITSFTHASRWLSSLVTSEGTVQIIYGESKVAIISTRDFLDNWQDIFCPGRDDAVIIFNLSTDILYYCHEDEWTYGSRV